MGNIFTDQRGIAVHAVLAAFILLAVIGFAGYKVSTLTRGTADSKSVVTVPTDEPETIQSKSDLSSTDKALDVSANEMESSLDDSTLDADLNSML